jgi:hypothetical protein
MRRLIGEMGEWNESSDEALRDGNFTSSSRVGRAVPFPRIFDLSSFTSQIIRFDNSGKTVYLIRDYHGPLRYSKRRIGCH